MSVDRHSLARAVGSMVVGTAKDLEQRREELGIDALGEIEHQFQVPVSGTAGQVPDWQTTELQFDVEFYRAQLQRDSPLTIPQFTYGSSIAGGAVTGNPRGAVAVHATVSEWVEDERALTGAFVTIGIWVPPGSSEVTFEGLVHLTFQGYGAPAENSADLDIGT